MRRLTRRSRAKQRTIEQSGRRCLNNLGSGPFLCEQRFFAVDIRMIPFVNFFVQCILHDVWRRVYQKIEQLPIAEEHESVLYPLFCAVDFSHSI